MGRTQAFVIWAGLIIAMIVPMVAAASSPLLAWRDPIYIIAGLSGVLAFVLLLLQPLLAGGALPALSARRSRQFHRWVGIMLVVTVVTHVVGLWITSPPDVIDALLFVSATPFSAWGVVAMWAIFIAALLAALRKALRLRPHIWRLAHTTLVTVTVIGTVVHALLIDGTMEMISKVLLCVLVFGATVKVVFNTLSISTSLSKSHSKKRPL
ncbi:MAG: ferric reductase-like transmembrane domain-containing protein [Hyphomicrobiales bacterium]